MKGLKGFTNMSAGISDKKNLYGNAKVFSFSEHPNEKLQLRLIGYVRGYTTHWIKIKTKTGKEVSVPKMCLNYNAETDTFTDNHCPYCDLTEDKVSRKYLVNAIWRKEQAKEPKEVSRTAKEDRETTLFEDWECKVKDPDSESWTPVICLNIPRGVAMDLEDISRNNITKKGEQKDITDPKYGLDVCITYRPEKAGEAKYKVEPTNERTPLTDDEKDYLVWDIENIPEETLEEAKKEAKSLSDKLLNPIKTSDNTKTITYDDDDEDKPVKAKSKSFDLDDDDDDKPVKAKSKSFDDDDDDDVKPVKKVSKSFDDDEDDSDSEEDEDDDFE